MQLDTERKKGRGKVSNWRHSLGPDHAGPAKPWKEKDSGCGSSEMALSWGVT